MKIKINPKVNVQTFGFSIYVFMCSQISVPALGFMVLKFR